MGSTLVECVLQNGRQMNENRDDELQGREKKYEDGSLNEQIHTHTSVEREKKSE